MSQKWSPEITFFPKKHPHEITDLAAGKELVQRINEWMAANLYPTGVFMVAKLDPHHNVYQPNETWIVEICPFTYFELSWLDKEDADYKPFMRAIDRLFKGLRKEFDLVPSKVWHKGGIEYHCTQGGGHCHISADQYDCDTRWYTNMEAFHRNLAIDYANRPYVRWLLSHWLASAGHYNVVNEQDLKDRPTENDIFYRMLYNTHAVESRFMASAKNLYPTWEFRILGMVENARQLRAGVLLLKAWMDDIQNGPKRKFSLTAKKWDSYTTLHGAKKACKAWVTELKLDWKDYEKDFFDRNYRLRIENQKFD